MPGGSAATPPQPDGATRSPRRSSDAGASQPQPWRLLLIGQAIAPGETGGLTIALADLQAQLIGRGWNVESAAYTTQARLPEMAPSSPEPVALRPTNAASRLAGLSRWRWAGWIGQRLPRGARQAIELLSMPGSFWADASINLERVDALLAQPDRYDCVLLAPSTIDAPGLMALATSRHPRVVLVGLGALSTELRAWWWPWWGALLRRRRAHRYHRCLLKRVVPSNLALGVFASRQWYDDAVRAGFPAARARLVPFAVPLPRPLPRRSSGGSRLLWVGRLSREKGLHLLLDALPAIRRSVPRVHVTAIAAQGPAGYRTQILSAIRDLELEDAVDLRPAVAREELQAAYAGHDVLFFYSPYTDPVALVVMEAFAAGLPVVASRAAPDAQLIHDRTTCLCYCPGNGRSLAEAVVCLLGDRRLSVALAANAGRLIREHFAPEAMGQAYDDLLRGLLLTPARPSGAHGVAGSPAARPSARQP